MSASTYAFATSEDLVQRWRPLSADEAILADVLLGDAGLMLRQKVAVDETDQAQLDALKLVSCNMVKRAMVANASSGIGVDETSAQMGPFHQTMHFSNPSGDLYLSAAERDLLGIDDGGYIGSIPARIEGFYGSNS